MTRTALITGGTGGLGAAVTRVFLDGGWRVVVPVFDPGERGRVHEHEALTLHDADLLDAASVDEVVGLADAEAAPLAAAVNLVGGFAMGARAHETPVDEFERLLTLNLRPTYLVCAAAIGRMLARGQGGSVVCVGARAATHPNAKQAGYVTAKAGVLALAAALDAEYRDDGIRVNAIVPTTLDTPANRAAMPNADPSRWSAPEDVARTVAWLCSDAASTVRGARIPV